VLSCGGVKPAPSASWILSQSLLTEDEPRLKRSVRSRNACLACLATGVARRPKVNNSLISLILSYRPWLSSDSGNDLARQLHKLWVRRATDRNEQITAKLVRRAAALILGSSGNSRWCAA